MNVKNQVVAVLLTAVIMPVSAGTLSGYGEIVNVDPVRGYVDKIVEYEDCYISRGYTGGSYNDGSSIQTQQILGGILGGALGNQFGGGNGKKAMTVAGALLGASVASDSARMPTSQDKPGREICETKSRTKSVMGIKHYLVEYKYQGKSFFYQTQYRPNNKYIELEIAVRRK